MKYNFKLALISLTIFLSSLQTQASFADSLPSTQISFNPLVIYEDDDRKDIYQVQDPITLSLADSTAALINSKKLVSINETDYSIAKAPSLGENRKTCKKEPYYNQPVAAHCTGFLVGPDLLATASHCILSKTICSSFKVVFDFNVQKKEILPKIIKKENVYSCIKVVAYSGVSSNDFAILQLDRTIDNRKPLAIRRSGTIRSNTPLLVIGHPMGLPKKIAGGAHVYSVNKRGFKANLDTYGGNSGSPVFNKETNLVEGILVSGAKDLDYDNKLKCVASQRCAKLDPNTECFGETSIKITHLADFIPEL